MSRGDALCWSVALGADRQSDKRWGGMSTGGTDRHSYFAVRALFWKRERKTHDHLAEAITLCEFIFSVKNRSCTHFEIVLNWVQWIYHLNKSTCIAKINVVGWTLTRCGHWVWEEVVFEEDCGNSQTAAPLQAHRLIKKTQKYKIINTNGLNSFISYLLSHCLPAFFLPSIKISVSSEQGRTLAARLKWKENKCNQTDQLEEVRSIWICWTHIQ